MRLLAFACAVLALVSCNKKDDSPLLPVVKPIDTMLIYGWWYYDQPRSSVYEYKGRFFGTNGEMKTDATNLGLGIGNYGGGAWYWSKDTIMLSGFGSVKFLVKQLTKDSLHVHVYGHRPSEPGAISIYYGR